MRTLSKTRLTHYRPSSFMAAPFFLLLCGLSAQAAAPQAEIDQAAKLVLQARDTQNPKDFMAAGEAAAKALATDPQNLDAQIYQAISLLGQEDLTAAMDLATRLNKRVPDDIRIWALLSEIHAARGNYAEAERCAQWVLDLRRNHPLGFSSAARLREVYGDYVGAAEFYTEAQRRSPQSDAEERSSLMVQVARMLFRTKDLMGAASMLDQAEKLFPASLQVLAQKAELARLNGDFALAASLLAKESQASPTAEHLYWYAQALVRAGRQDEAKTIFEKLDAAPQENGPELILLYADQKKSPERALTLATRQISVREDAPTLDAYAWALFRAGKFTEARTQIDRLLALGTRDPLYACHAVRIAAETRSIDSAAAHLPETTCDSIQ